ncbi:T6SS immunity protein Tli4 family protein [Trinickia symbiotica]|nr:T6SS immunity protein Tli4 family protein [Trinickia symbiotica]
MMRFAMALCASLLIPVCYAKEPLMSETKTYCIGRYLVDVPADAQINGQSYEYRFGRIETDQSAETAQGFQEKMEAREAELRAGKQKDGFQLTNVRRPSSSIWVFDLYQKLLLGPSSGFETHVWEHGTSFSMEETGYEPATLGHVLAELQTNLLPNVHARPSDSIPTAPGFCLKDGFVANDGTTSQFEDAAISFKFAQWPGVLVSVETMTLTKLGQPSLLQRIDGGGLPAAFKNLVSQIRILRRGQRTVNGRAGEEILSTLPTDAGYRLHQFQWEADGTEIGNGLKPTITVELESGMTQENGVPTRPLLTDEQAIALFDAVANSVRLRPVSTSATVAELPRCEG